MSRSCRAPRTAAALLALAVLATACGGTGAPAAPAGDADPDASGEAVTGADADRSGAPTDDAFPVTLEHRHGSTEVTAEPERVVTIGLRDVDAVLGLGVVPVATREWFGEQPGAVWPWAQDELEALGGQTPTVLDPVELDFEAISTLEPDLILAVDSAITVEEYETLSQIAPTVGPSDEHPDFGNPWQEVTATIGATLGRSDEADQLVDDVEAMFADAREANPRFEGATAVAALRGVDGTSYAYGPADTRARILTDLGLVLPDAIDELIADGEFFATLSPEQIGLLDADALVWIAATEAEFAPVLDDPLYQQLDVAEGGRDLFYTYDDIGAAMSYSSVLSLPEVLEQLVPDLAAALPADE